MSQQDVRYYVTDDRLWYGRNGRLTPRKTEAEVMNARDARRVLSDMGINWFIKSGDLQGGEHQCAVRNGAKHGARSMTAPVLRVPVNYGTPAG